MGWKDAPLVQSKTTSWQDAPIVGMPEAMPTPPQPASATPAPPIGDTQWHQAGYAQAATPRQQPQQPPMPWADVPGQALASTPASAGQFVSDVAQPFMHPVETAQSLGSLAMGVMRKAGAQIGDPNDAAAADAVGKFLMDRYGSEEAVKQTIAKDPVGLAADVSMILTAGGSVGARAPGVMGQAFRAAGTAGKAIDPLVAGVKGAGLVGKKVVAPVVSNVLGGFTGAGGMAVQEAAKAGAKGGQTGRAFREQMRGIAPIEDVVTDAKTALERMKQERSTMYRSGMEGVKADPTIIDFTPIDDALAKVSEVGTFKGQTIKPVAVGAMDEITRIVADWKNLDPSEFHTPEGLDALKQKIRAAGEGYDPMTQKQARIIADQAYNAVKNEIVKQAPEYADVMKGYEQASELIHDIEKTLSVNPKANVDATVRKLQSVMRNNANTNYGKRVDLAETLAKQGAPNLFPRLSGQALSSAMPRGIQGALAAPTALGTMATNPAMLPALLATSPRVVGEASHALGRGAGAVGKGYGMGEALLGQAGMTPRGIGAAAFQSGRTKEEMLKALGAR